MLDCRPITEHDPSGFCHRVTEAPANGWSLHGHPLCACHADRGVMRRAQAAVKEIGAGYDRGMKPGNL
ncbi:MAG: DUF1737 domain-containing protein [Paracoccaceae bacterium]